MKTPERELLPQIPGFRLIEEIGRGATSRVYRAAQSALDREVAVKIITTLGEQGQKRALRLFREARLSGALDHPGIVRGIDAGEGEDFCWFAMDLVDGEGLDELLEREQRLPVAEVLSLAEDLLEALDHVHRRGVTHRDVKPANILIDIDGAPRLLDLGLARRASDPGLTQEGGAVGTPQYMSPEQARRPDRVDGRSDLFSLGSTLYRAITGVAPFDAETVGAVLLSLLQQDAARPSTMVEDVPQAVDLVIMRALEKRPEHRYQSATEMLSDVRALRAGRAPAVHDILVRRRLLRGTAVTCVVLALVAVAVLAFRSDDTREKNGRPTVSDARDGTARTAAFDALVNDQSRYGSYFHYLDIRDAAARMDADDVDLKRRVDTARHAYVQKAEAIINGLADEASAALEAGDPKAPLQLTWSAVVTALKKGPLEPNQGDPLEARLMAHRERAQASLKSRRIALARETRDALHLKLETWDREHRGQLLTTDLVATELRGIRDSAGKLSNLLFTPDMSAIDEQISAIKRRHDGRPLQLWTAACAAARAHIDAHRYVSAEREIADALERIGPLVDLATGEAQVLRRKIAAGVAAELERARSIAPRIRRSEIAGLPLAERKRRLESMRGALTGLGDPTEIPGLDQVRTMIRNIVDLTDAAIGLRHQVLMAVGDLSEGEGTVFRPRVRRKGLVQPRTLVDRDGDTLIARDAVNGLRRYPIHELMAPCIVELAKAGGIEVREPVGPLLAYLDGDDGVALELSQGLPITAPSREFLIALSNEAVERRVESFDAAADRAAYRHLIEARRRIASSDVPGARSELRAIDAIKKTPGWSKRAFWKDNGQEILSLRRNIDAGDALRSAWAGFGRHLRADAEAGRVLLSLPLGTATAGIARVAPPARAELASDGIRLIGAKHLGQTRPDRLPPLVVDIPALPGATIDLTFEVVFEAGEFPASFLAISLHDVQFIVFGTTLDDRRFRALPLHGLERAIFTKNPVRQAGIWVGKLGGYPKRLQRPRPALDLPSDRSVPIRITSGPRGKDLTVRVDKSHVFKLPAKERPVLREGGLRITGFPTVRVSDLSLDVRFPK